MRNLFKKTFYVLMFAVTAPCFLFSGVYAQEEFGAASDSPGVQQTAAEVLAYWTAERMADAIPIPMPTVEATGDELSAVEEEVSSEPSFGVGMDAAPPNQAFDPIPTETVDAAPAWGGPPGNWITSYPGPFQRWTWFGRYTTYPTSTIGKMFFTQGGTRFVCSGAVINAGPGERDVIATAAHCVHQGRGGGFSTNVLFCPSQNPAGSPQGCWPAVDLGTFTEWINNTNVEADIGCIIARDFGTRWNQHIGDRTGELGWFVWSSSTGWQQPWISLGYPQGSPMNTRNGGLIVIASGPGWYTLSWGSLADAMYMGNDMTGGSSGGPWVLGWEHAREAYRDTDGSNATDPYPGGPPNGPRIGGVNSHKIVRNGVLRTQEMGSAQFRTSNPDVDGFWNFCNGLANAS